MKKYEVELGIGLQFTRQTIIEAESEAEAYELANEWAQERIDLSVTPIED